MLPTLETNRLILRAPRATDLLAFNFYAKKRTIGPNAGWAPHESINDTKMILDLFITEKNVWAITIKPYDVMVGSLGMHNRTYDFIDGEGVHIGFVLDDTYWNKGYMTEAVQCVVDYIFKDLNFDYIMIGHADYNIASQRVIQKCGFHFAYTEEKDNYNNTQKINVLYYKMTREEYLND